MSRYRCVAVAGLKGGIGKSTIAINLACGFHSSKRRTLLVDADSQGTIRTWAGKGAEDDRDLPPVVALDARTMMRDLPRVAESYDVVVIDSPARLGAEARAAMMAADLVLLPVLPGAADVWALKDTLEVLDEARGLKPGLDACLILNRLDRTTLADAMRQYVDRLEVPIIGELGSRVAFGNATLAGQGVVTYAPSTPAAEEFATLFSQVSNRVFGGRNHAKKAKR